MTPRSLPLLALSLCAGLFIGSLAQAATDPWYIGPNAEVTWNYSLGQIKAPVAYGRGYVGTGQVVAVFDSGIDTSSNQFAGRIAGAGYDALTGKTGVTTDNQWHGTFVSAIIAANRDGIGMMGVAYNAKILPVRIVNKDGSVNLSDASLAKAVQFATAARAIAYNNSWNASSPITAFTKASLDAALPATLAAYRAAVSAGSVVVFAAGNNAAKQPGLYAALPVYYPELKPGWLAAVATDSTGALASYSNACGAAAAWCLAAPGSDIISVYNGGYGVASGTSFAAPALSAAVAILKQEFPYLSGPQILAILFATANKSGIYADSTIYGQGLLDLDKATQPIGALTVRTVSASGATSLAAASMTLSTAFGRGFVRALSDEPLVVRDDFGRGYQISLTALASTGALAFDAQNALTAFGDNLNVTKTEDGTVAFSSDVVETGSGFSSASLPAKFFIERNEGRNFAIASYNLDPSFALAPVSGGIARSGAAVNADALAVPYLSLAQNAVALAYGTRTTAGGALRLGVFTGRALSVPESAVEAMFPAGAVKTASVTGFVTAFDMPLSTGADLGFDTGVVMEQGTVLGSTTSGAASFGQNTPTYFAGLRGAVALARGLTLEGAAHLGLTQPAAAANSIIENTSSLLSTSFNVALTKTDIGRVGDRLAFVLSQPLRVISGTAHLVVPEAVDFDGATLYRAVDAPLKADGQELDIQGFYGFPIAQGEKVDFGAMVRLQPDNVADAPPDGVMMSRYRLAF